MHDNQKLIRNVDDITLYNRFITGLFSILGESACENLSESDLRYFCSFLCRINEVATEETEVILGGEVDDVDCEDHISKRTESIRSFGLLNFFRR